MLTNLLRHYRYAPATHTWNACERDKANPVFAIYIATYIYFMVEDALVTILLAMLVFSWL